MDDNKRKILKFVIAISIVTIALYIVGRIVKFVFPLLYILVNIIFALIALLFVIFIIIYIVRHINNKF